MPLTTASKKSACGAWRWRSRRRRPRRRCPSPGPPPGCPRRRWSRWCRSWRAPPRCSRSCTPPRIERPRPTAPATVGALASYRDRARRPRRTQARICSGANLLGLHLLAAAVQDRFGVSAGLLGALENQVHRAGEGDPVVVRGHRPVIGVARVLLVDHLGHPPQGVVDLLGGDAPEIG